MSLLIRHFYRFADFTLDTDQRVLLRDGKPVALTPKVFETLLVLAEHNGRIVTKEEFMKRLWPDSFVEESNLIFNIQQLRRALGDDARRPVYVQTVARRGYRLIAPVEEMLSDASPSEPPASRFSSSDAQSHPDVLNRMEGSQNLSTDAGNHHRTTTSEECAAAIDVARTPSTRIGKRRVAIAFALVVLAAVAGFAVWKSVTNSGNDLRRTTELSSPSSIKLEKLTVTGESSHGAISPDGKYLAYSRDRNRKSSVWLRQLATNTNVEIVPATERVHGLTFSNSGEFLYIVKGDPTTLYRVSLLGGVPNRILDDLSGAFSISSDDSQIAFVRKSVNSDEQQEYQLMIANSDGTGERELLKTTHPNAVAAPTWSLDGKSIVCAYGSSAGGSRDVSIIEVTVANGTRTEVSPDKFFHVTRIAFLPNRTGLILSARRNFQDNTQLWRLSERGSEFRQITEGFISYGDLSLTATADKAVTSQTVSISDLWIAPAREPQNLKKITQAIDNFCWTPNGQIVYSSTTSGVEDLWIMQPDQVGLKQLTANSGVNGTPAVTPDNRYIVFMSNRTGSFQVWRMDVDGGNQKQLTYGSAKNFPAISPDGKWVFCDSTDNWHLCKVSIDGRESEILTEYPAAYPAVSPDGRFVAALGRDGAKRDLVLLPVEGGLPMRRFKLVEGDFSGNRLQWTVDGRALIYAVELNGEAHMIKQQLGGGVERITSFGDEDLFDFGYSFDGRFLAVTRGEWQHDIVLVSNLDRH